MTELSAQTKLSIGILIWLIVSQLMALGSLESFERYSVPLNPGQSCTVFYASDGELALGGNNETRFDLCPWEQVLEGRRKEGPRNAVS